MSTRRHFMLGSAVALATTLLGRHARAVRARPRARPHYVVNIILSGGVDAVLVSDPKLSGESIIETKYRADDRLRGRQRMYGPLFGDMMRHESDLCLVHGVRVDTVGHDEALLMLSRGKITSSHAGPTIGDLVGAALPGEAPLEHLLFADEKLMSINPLDPRGYQSPAILIAEEWQRRMLWGLQPSSTRPSWGANLERPAWAAQMEREQRAEALALLGNPRVAEEYRRSATQVEGLTQYVHSAPHTTTFRDPKIGLGLELALHAIASNSARFITVASERAWYDTHTDNERLQRERVMPAFADIAAFIDRLKLAHNAFGSLFEQTTLLIGSELGRFPKYNAVGGKDHWPESSWILCGKGVARTETGLTFGATDANYRGRPTDFATGAFDGGAQQPIYLDNLYATLMSIAGGSLANAGYRESQVIRRLVA